jgi:hypothetical protein
VYEWNIGSHGLRFELLCSSLGRFGLDSYLRCPFIHEIRKKSSLFEALHDCSLFDGLIFVHEFVSLCMMLDVANWEI